MMDMLNHHRPDSGFIRVSNYKYSSSHISLENSENSPNGIKTNERPSSNSNSDYKHHHYGLKLRPIHSLAAKGDLESLKEAVKYNRKLKILQYKNHSSDISLTELIIYDEKNVEKTTEPFCIDIRNQYGMTALHGACYFGHYNVVSYLLSEGSDANAYSYCPFFYSKDQGISEAEFSLTKKFNPTKWATPLHFAACNGNKYIVALLLESGANPALLDYKKLTPEAIARCNNHKKTAAFIQAFTMAKQCNLLTSSSTPNFHRYSNKYESKKKKENLFSIINKGWTKTSSNFQRLFHPEEHEHEHEEEGSFKAKVKSENYKNINTYMSEPNLSKVSMSSPITTTAEEVFETIPTMEDLASEGITASIQSNGHTITKPSLKYQHHHPINNTDEEEAVFPPEKLKDEETHSVLKPPVRHHPIKAWKTLKSKLKPHSKKSDTTTNH